MTPTVDEVVLKPCPFCGSEALLMDMWVVCGNQKCWFDSMAFIEEWNTRAVPTGCVVVPRPESVEAATDTVLYLHYDTAEEGRAAFAMLAAETKARSEG